MSAYYIIQRWRRILSGMFETQLRPHYFLYVSNMLPLVVWFCMLSVIFNVLQQYALSFKLIIHKLLSSGTYQKINWQSQKLAPIKIINSTVFVNVLKVYSDQNLTFFNKVFQNHDVIFILNRNCAFVNIDPCVLTSVLQNTLLLTNRI